MAERVALLLRVPGVRAGWVEGAGFFCCRCDSSSPALPVLSGEREFQGFDCGVRLRDSTGDGLIRAADDSFRLFVPGDSADYPATVPGARRCAAVGDSVAVWFVGEHAWLVVAGADFVFSHLRRRAGGRDVGEGRVGALDAGATPPADSYWRGIGGGVVCESFWMAAGFLSV